MPGAPPAQQDFDLGRDFSLAANPSGPWRYGHTSGTTLAARDFVLDTFSVDRRPIGLWHPGSDRASHFPYVAGNLGHATAAYIADRDGHIITVDVAGRFGPDAGAEPVNGWAIDAGQVALEASNTGQYALVQFVAPRAGDYAINATFTGIHTGLSTTDVHALLGEESLFSALIDGYAGDPRLHRREGASPTASYHGSRVLRAGDVLTFAVGFGANHTHFYDTTGLSVVIRDVQRR